MPRYLIILLSGLVWGECSFAQGTPDLKKGEELYQACIQCHGKSGEGNLEQLAPKIAGQFDWYIEAQIKNFQNKTRKNPKMDPFISKLSGQNVADLALYISKLK